jgi:hypothetical protein
MAIEEKLRSIDKLKQELEEAQQQVLANQDAHELVQNMLD